MNPDNHSQRRRWGAFTFLTAAAGAALAAATIPVASADPADDVVGVAAASVKLVGCCEIQANNTVYDYFDAHDGSKVAIQAVENLDSSLHGLSYTGASADELMAILFYGGSPEVGQPEAIAAAAIGGGGLEKLADADVFNYFDAHDGASAAKFAVEVLNADLAGLSNPGATALEELVIAIFGGGGMVTPTDLF